MRGGESDLLFSVLVPTRDRADLAKGCVRAILGQQHDSYEVLVLDQSEGNATQEAVARAAGGSERIHHLRVAGAGRSRALNAGIPRARGKWLVITDDDCEAAPGWLAALEHEVNRAREREAIVGRVLPGPVEPGKAVPPATIEAGEPSDFAGRIDRDLIYPNFAVPRSAFAELGMFDERMGVGTQLPGGEDNDFGYRLLRSGWRILYRPAPTVIHRAWRSEEARAALKRSYGIGQGAFYAKHIAAADPFIAYRFARDVFRTARAAAGAAVRGWPRECRGHLAFLGGLFVGALKMASLMMRSADPGGGRSSPAATGDIPRVRRDRSRREGGIGAWSEHDDGTDRLPSPGPPGTVTAPAFEKAPETIVDPGETRRSKLSGVVQLELSSGDLRVPAIPRTGLVYVVLRWKGAPVGRLILERDHSLPEPEFRRAALEAAAVGIVAVEAERVEEGFAAAVARLSARREASPAMPASDVSVIIATRDRPGNLAACLEALGALDPAPGEIVVVDSASSNPEEVAAAASRPGVRVIRLDRPGLSRARNAGALAASGKVLAFLDDDCLVDAGWLASLCAGFSEEGVEAVTGQLLPLELETEAQIQFLRYSHMDRRGFAPRRFDRTLSPSPYFPIDAWRMGSGGNLAIQSDAFMRVGGFRLSLGLGTPALGGEDLYLLWSLIEAGGAVVYRPGAMAWHRHHRTDEALRRVLFGYGAGHAAYLRAIRRAGAPRRALGLYRLSFWADRLARLARSLAARSPVPAALVLREVAGYLAGARLGRKAEKQAALEESTGEKVEHPSLEVS